LRPVPGFILTESVQGRRPAHLTAEPEPPIGYSIILGASIDPLVDACGKVRGQGQADPITGIGPCARAAIGHATAPPMSVMNPRLFIQ
jgi:hypothetical protein